MSALKFTKNESLIDAVNFGVGSTFSIGPVPGLGPLYKVCPPFQAKVNLRSP